jgi:hypothetical protein
MRPSGRIAKRQAPNSACMTPFKPRVAPLRGAPQRNATKFYCADHGGAFLEMTMRLLAMAGGGIVGFWGLVCAVISWMMLAGYIVGIIVATATLLIVGLLASGPVMKPHYHDIDNRKGNQP